MFQGHLWKTGNRQESCLNCFKPMVTCDFGEQCRMTNELKEAIISFADNHGKQWKSKLLALWQKGEDTGSLRLVRNIIGPSRLHKLKIEYLRWR